MIKEDYVSFETAKLLKDKGFDEYVTRSYFENDGIYAPCDPSEVKRKDVIAIPTLQMAMKWLREMYELYIVIRPYVAEEGIFSLFDIKNVKDKNMVANIRTKTGFNDFTDKLKSM